MTAQQFNLSNSSRQYFRRIEQRLRINVFATLLEILQHTDSLPRTIQEYHLHFKYYTPSLTLQMMNVNQVDGAFTGRDQPRFTEIANAICFICKLCTQLYITFKIFCLNVSDYDRFQLTQFQSRIINFLHMESTKRPLNYRVTIRCSCDDFTETRALREREGRLPENSQSKFPNFRMILSEGNYLKLERVHNGYNAVENGSQAGPSSNNGPLTSQPSIRGFFGKWDST